MAREQPRIGHIGKAVPLCRGAGEQEWPAALAADRRVDRERHAHVHRVAEGVSDDGMRPVHAPAKTVALRRREHLVLLGVIEVFDIEPRLLLAKRRRRQRAFAISLERAEIMLQARHERDMRHRARWRQRIQQIAHHRAIDPDVFGFRLLPQPGAEEDLCGTQPLQGGPQRRRIEQVCRDRRHAVDVGRRPPRQSVHLPAPLAQMPGEIVADDTAGADDECGFSHVPILSLSSREIGKDLSA